MLNKVMKILPLSILMVVVFSSNVYGVVTSNDNGIDIRNPVSEGNIVYNTESNDVYVQDENTLEQQMDQELANETLLNLVTDTSNLENDTGALWTAHEDYFTDIKEQVESKYGEGAYDSTEEIIKDKYNPVENTFDCGRFEVDCHFMSIGLTFMTSFIQTILQPLSLVSVNPSVIMDTDIATGFIEAFSILTNSLLAVFLIFQIIKITTLKMGNFDQAQPELTDKLTKTIIAVFLIGSYDDLFRIILNLQFVVVYPIINTFTNTSALSQSLVIKMFFQPSMQVIMIVFLILALLLLVVVIQFFYNIAFLTLLYITGPISITTMVNDEYNFFSLWLRNIVARCLTVLMQSICIVISLITLLNVQSDLSENIFNTIMCFAFLVLAMSVPTILQQFGNSSGSGKATVATLKSIGRGISK